jgi:hypothetical protein
MVAGRDEADVPAGDRNIRLTPTEWRPLEVLLQHPGMILSQQQLLAEVWGPGYARTKDNLRLYIAQLRRKLEPDPARRAGCSPSLAWAIAFSQGRRASDGQQPESSRPWQLAGIGLFG